MSSLKCLLGKCLWEVTPGSVHIAGQELFVWKCMACQKKRTCTSDTDPERIA